jgi:hypothetical protein
MRAIVSAHTSGEWSEISRITWPRFSEYASRHGATFYGEVIGPTYRPPAWSKLTSIAKAFVEADEVLWLDTDVLIIDGRQSIFDEVTDGLAWQSAVPHTCEQRGRHFNTGVWLLRRAMIPELVIAAMQDDCISHPWWEQAAFIELQGHPKYRPFIEVLPRKYIQIMNAYDRIIDRQVHWCPGDWALHLAGLKVSGHDEVAYQRAYLPRVSTDPAGQARIDAYVAERAAINSAISRSA